jgi:hypothetical protein
VAQKLFKFKVEKKNEKHVFSNFPTGGKLYTGFEATGL